MSANRAVAVHARGLHFEYPRSGRAVGGEFRLKLDSWVVESGSRVALWGPSGCGKSTLLDLIAGVILPTSGGLEVDGCELGSMSESERRAHRIRGIGFVFQDYPLVEYLDVEENVLFPYRLNSALKAREAPRERARELLSELGIVHKAKSLPSELSQGERQRVAIARALVTRPRLLLADEPTAGLDPEQSLEVLEILETLRRDSGLTLIMVTHDPSLLSRFDDVLAVAELSTADRRPGPTR